MKLKNYRFKSTEISSYLNQSHKVKTTFFTLFYKTDQPYLKFAFIIPKKLGNAVFRNKKRRQLKEAFYKSSHLIKPGVQIIIIANEKIKITNFKLIHNMLLLTLKKRNLIYEEHLSISY